MSFLGVHLRVRPETNPETLGACFPKRDLGRFGDRSAETGWDRSGGRPAERPLDLVRGRFRKRPPVVFVVVKAVSRIGLIEEAAARF
jgi:hypothetical protein